MIEWAWGVSRPAWEARGFGQAQAPAHCTFPGVQAPEVQAFVDKFLHDDASANTSVARDAYRTDLSRWVTWSTPELK